MMITVLPLKFYFKIMIHKTLWRYQHYYVSTPIFYVNGAPHIGHLQSCLYADALARVNRLIGKDVLFSTGTDEHGLKVQQAAEALKLPVSDHCTHMSSKFKNTFESADISFTHFVRTTDERHKKVVQNFWIKLNENGFIRKDKYEGWYSVIDEAFVPASQVKEIKEKSQIKLISSETGSPVEKMSEENYVFSLSKFQNELLYWLSKDVIKPSLFGDNVKKLVSEGLHDLSVSRPRSRLFWGIPVPNDDTQIIYVWLDALVNYLTVSQNQHNKHWPPDCHVIGKDILKFHAIYWPAFLIAAGYEPPRQIFCHSHWTVNYEKMSKSRGNVIDPSMLIEKYESDGFRYFMLRASVPHSDTNYSEEKAQRLVNAELASKLGNLLSRSSAKAVNPMQAFPKFYHEVLHKMAAETNVHNLINAASNLPEKVQSNFSNADFYNGLECILECLRETNAFMQHCKPWELTEKTDEESKKMLSTILHVVLEVLRISGLLLQPVIPRLSAKLLDKLGVTENERTWQNISCFLSYKNLPNPLEDKPLGAVQLPLYERKKS